MYTLEEIKQIIKEKPHAYFLNYEDLQEVLDSTDNTRRFKITSWLNTQDYMIPTTDYYITELDE